MYYTEIALIALIVIIAYLRPRVVRGGLGKAVLVVAVLLIARYTNRNSGILAAIAAIALIHVSNTGIEGMDVNPDAKPAPPLTDDDQLVADDNQLVADDNQLVADDNNVAQEDKSKEKLSKMDLECISRALRSCSSNEMPVNRETAGETTQAPEGTVAAAGKGTEAFYA
jgi:hypothetical protein